MIYGFLEPDQVTSIDPENLNFNDYSREKEPGKIMSGE